MPWAYRALKSRVRDTDYGEGLQTQQWETLQIHESVLVSFHVVTIQRAS